MSVNSKRVSELVTEVQEGKLILRPIFQRRLIWTNRNKEFFIETVLKNYPFPEIFQATGELDLKTGRRENWLIDGQQRVSTLVAYKEGSPDILYKTIPRYEELSDERKKAFMDYSVAVRDLGIIDLEHIRDIFKRINSTDYALKKMEKLNAMYSGAYKDFCESLSVHRFFDEHDVFSGAARRRMYDLTFCVILVTTILAGYFRRDEKNKEYLDRYNDDFPDQTRIQDGLERVFAFLGQCGFRSESRAWRLTDLFTLLVELYSALIEREIMLDPTRVGAVLSDFYDSVDALFKMKGIESSGGTDKVFRYLKAASKATNDKYARIERAKIVSELLEEARTPSILQNKDGGS